MLPMIVDNQGQIDKENEKMRKKMEASVLKENDGARTSRLPEEVWIIL